MSEFWAEVLIEFLPTEKGGRSEPLNLSNDLPERYKLLFRVMGGSGGLLAVAVMDGPDEPLLPGESTYATVKGLNESVSYDELTLGKEFEVLEGTQVVGRGHVTRM